MRKSNLQFPSFSNLKLRHLTDPECNLFGSHMDWAGLHVDTVQPPHRPCGLTQIIQLHSTSSLGQARQMPMPSYNHSVINTRNVERVTSGRAWVNPINIVPPALQRASKGQAFCGGQPPLSHWLAQRYASKWAPGGPSEDRHF